MKVIPSKKQWKHWSLPAKASYVGLAVGIIGIVTGILVAFGSWRWPRDTASADYIPETEFTHKQLERTFPFGYTVIYPTENKRFRYEVFKSGLMEWTLDVEKVAVAPNFSAGSVLFTLMPASAKGDGQSLTFPNTTLQIECPLKKGVFRRAGFKLGNNPVPHVGVLSASQRNPVFTIGFRILEPGEGRPPASPFQKIP